MNVESASHSTRLKFLLRSHITEAQGQLLTEVDEVPFVPMEAIGERGEIDLSAKRPIEQVITGYTRFFENDVLVAKITPCFENGKGAIVKGTGVGVGFGTTELHVLSPLDHVSNRFLYYVTSGADFRGLGQAMMSGAAGQKRVPDEFVRDYRITLPAFEQQEQIANFLDQETATIDAMIAAKQRLLTLLGEKRRALITHAVTRGLNSDAPMRDSGVEWLGEIPAHWNARRLAYHFTERDERNQPDLPLLVVSLTRGVVLREFSDDKIEGTAADFGTYKVSRRGDIAFNKMRMWQGAVGATPQDGLVSPDYVVAEPVGDICSEYAELLFRTPAFSAECARHSHGIVWDRLRLYWEGFKNIVVPIPPVAEQREIAAQLCQRTQAFDAFRLVAEKSIQLLRERRSSLIAAAVTGEIDVEAVA